VTSWPQFPQNRRATSVDIEVVDIGVILQPGFIRGLALLGRAFELPSPFSAFPLPVPFKVRENFRTEKSPARRNALENDFLTVCCRKARTESPRFPWPVR
jgi:hypothetical protein